MLSLGWEEGSKLCLEKSFKVVPMLTLCYEIENATDPISALRLYLRCKGQIQEGAQRRHVALLKDRKFNGTFEDE